MAPASARLRMVTLPPGHQMASKFSIIQRSENQNGRLNVAIIYLAGGDPVWEMTLEKSVRDLAWSPDGSKFVISTADGMLLINRNRSNQIQLIPNLFSIANLVWSPDGKYIAFLASASRQAPPNLYTIQTDGSSLVNLTNSSLGGASTASWSPDGNWLVYDSPKDSGHGNIFVSNPDGSQQYRLTQSDGSLEYLTPSWQPGDRGVSDQPGEREIYG